MALARPEDPTSLAEFPVTVLAVLGTEVTDTVTKEPVDLAFVRYFDVLARKDEHPVVCSCGYVAEPLPSRAVYSIVPVCNLVRPVFLVPCVRATPTLEPRCVRAISATSATRVRKFFWLDPARPQDLA